MCQYRTVLNQIREVYNFSKTEIPTEKNMEYNQPEWEYTTDD